MTASAEPDRAAERSDPPSTPPAPPGGVRVPKGRQWPSRWTRAESLATFATVAVFWAALVRPWLSGVVTIPWDATAHFQPQFSFLAASLAKGQSPFWNPYVFAGHPQVADPQSLIFSLPHWLVARLMPEPGFIAGDAVVLGMLLAGALALVALFRDRGWAPVGAALAALAFAFGAAAAWRLQHAGQILSLSWFAISLWLLARALGRRSALWGLLAGIAIGFMLLGRDQVALLGAYTLAGFVLAAWIQSASPIRAVGRSFVPLSAAALAALAVAGLPVLWTLELAVDSNRPGIDLAGAERGSLHPGSLLTLAIANLYGAAGPFENSWGPPSWTWNSVFGDVDLFLARNMSVLYLGAIPLLLIGGIGLLRGRATDAAIRAVTLAVLLLLVYALGRYTPGFRLMFEWLPGVKLYRRPADALFNLGAMMALLAGYLAHVLATKAAPPAGRWRWAVGLLAIVATFAAAGTLAMLVGREGVAAPAMITAALCLTLGVAALWFVPRLHRRSPIAAMLFATSVLVVDLAVNNGPSESTALPPARYDVLHAATDNATIARLKQELARTAAPDRRDRIELAGIDFHWPNASMVHGFDHVLGYNPLRLGIFSAATGAGDQVALPDQRVFSALMPGYRSLLADLLGLRFIVAKVPPEQIDKRLQPGDLIEVARTEDGTIWENPRALPRVLAVGRASRIDPDALIASGEWPAGFDPTTGVLLDRDPACVSEQPGRAAILSYGNTEIEVEVEMPGCGYLVLNDVWQRWWTAEVNGTPAPVLRANGLFRAVAVPAGTSQVRFVFRPLRGLLADIAVFAERIRNRFVTAGVS